MEAVGSLIAGWRKRVMWLCWDFPMSLNQSFHDLFCAFKIAPTHFLTILCLCFVNPLPAAQKCSSTFPSSHAVNPFTREQFVPQERRVSYSLTCKPLAVSWSKSCFGRREWGLHLFIQIARALFKSFTDLHLDVSSFFMFVSTKKYCPRLIWHALVIAVRWWEMFILYQGE